MRSEKALLGKTLDVTVREIKNLLRSRGFEEVSHEVYELERAGCKITLKVQNKGLEELNNKENQE